MTDVVNWSCEDVEYWLQANNFTRYRQLLCEEHKIDGLALLSLTEDDLRRPPLNIPVLGDVKRLVIKINILHQENQAELRSFVHLNGSVGDNRSNIYTPPRLNISNNNSDWEYAQSAMGSPNLRGRCSQSLDPEIWKTVLSFVYVFSVTLLTSFVMVVVHDRVPDMQKFPPLPDFFLDNMPYVSWAFEACELVGLTLSLMWCSILFFHKHRFILMRRMFSLAGTIFLLRCITMFITSLSVPGTHLQCSGKTYGSFWTKLERAFEIWKGCGMTLQGVRTCGDYMFSGHTAIITLLNFFITEYTPQQKAYLLHMLSWVLNVFGIFFILAAHEHYSIDVFISFYLSSRLFMYYHTLANNRSLMQQDADRTRVWFPMFAFFESKCDGVVPNQYEWPLPSPFRVFQYFQNKLKVS
ncbi:LOW QUALITY PROTEIN: sphingomyelin synthase-related protein 1-like [Haliotis rubra]|uniref:LOW QUALITY PROTEIN: sphingomyelin synthase-related protein 1-like n=1 Tax=Haliotis rubra TaxID=36100 RepID=UPI001EE591FF|nr:LOW QUALITY PROTEIN: sphingomyelin synthase-related protein 1-like [Haliotis rubra]